MRHTITAEYQNGKAVCAVGIPTPMATELFTRLTRDRESLNISAVTIDKSPCVNGEYYPLKPNELFAVHYGTERKYLFFEYVEVWQIVDAIEGGSKAALVPRDSDYGVCEILQEFEML